MAESTNNVTMVGNLTRDPEMRHTGNGTPICQLSVSLNHRKRKDGEEPVSFIDVEVWGALAEVCSEHLSRGRKVAVVGYVKQDRWEQDGQRRSKVFVVGNSVEFLGAPGGGNGNGGGSRQSDDLAPAGSYSGAAPAASDDPDIPF